MERIYGCLPKRQKKEQLQEERYIQQINRYNQNAKTLATAYKVIAHQKERLALLEKIQSTTKKDPQKKEPPLGIDLTKKAKQQNLSLSLRGRESDLEQLKVATGKTETPNVILVGPPGSGKTCLVEAWAHEIAHNTNPSYQFKDTILISISASDIISGASLVGIAEARVNQLIEYGKTHPNVIFFIDELHSIMSDGSSSTNGIPNMLKKALSDGDIRMIGCTTNEEFKLIEKDPAFKRRFSVIDFKPPTEAIIQDILAKKCALYAKKHNVTYPQQVILKARELTRKLPGHDPAKTLTFLNTAGSLCRVRGLQTVTPEILDEVYNKTPN